MENFLNPSHSFLRNFAGPSKGRKSYFLTNLIFNNINEFEKKIYSPGFHQELYQKLTKCFRNFILIP